MPKLTVGTAVTKAQQLLQEAGVPAEQAAITARCIVASDRWGIGSHGLMRLPFYLSRLKAGGINPTAQLKTVTDLPSLVVFDGDDGLGHWQLQKAAEIASERAIVNGVAAVGVGRSNHCGALGIYVWPMINRGLVGIAFSTGPAVMPPWGGDKALLSTSPIAAGIPTNPPTVVDLATSAVARGKIQAKAQAGAELEPGWAFTKDGRPTTDAKEALAGMLAPLG
jgi:(2R)-3-sulfolactate dehydrogenase (NADP+)